MGEGEICILLKKKKKVCVFCLHKICFYERNDAMFSMRRLHALSLYACEFLPYFCECGLKIEKASGLHTEVDCMLYVIRLPGVC